MKKIWDIPSIKEKAKEYDSLPEFKKSNKSCYQAAVKYKILAEVTSHMTRGRCRKLTKEDVIQKALEYTDKKKFKAECGGHYNAAYALKVADKAFSHMIKPIKPKPIRHCISCNSDKRVAGKIPRCVNCYRKEVNPQSYENIKAYNKKKRQTSQGRHTNAKRQAKMRKIAWGLTKEEYFELNSKPCYYCGGPLPKSGCGLDRMVNDKNVGYVPGNVLPCCGQCNSIKGDKLTVSETVAAIDAIRSQRWENIRVFHEEDYYIDSRDIFIFGEINGEKAIRFRKAMDVLESVNSFSEITITIMSEGGDWFDGLSIYDRIKASPCPIKTVGTGMVASTATAILQAGGIREITPSCIFVLHDGNEGFEGEAKSFEAWADASKKSRQLLYEIYSEKSGKPTSFWQTLCLKDSVLWGKEILKYGLADRIKGSDLGEEEENV